MLQFTYKRRIKFNFVKWDDSTGETRIPSMSLIDRSPYRKSLSITRLNRRSHPPLSHGSSQKGRRCHGEKGEREGEREKEKERGLSASKWRFARSNTRPGRYTWPFNICIYLKACVCVCFYPCVPHHIDRFLAVCRRDHNARYRAQTDAFDTFLPRNWAPVTEFFIRKPRLDEPGTTSIYRIRNPWQRINVKNCNQAFTLWSSSRTKDTLRNIFHIRKKNGTA